MVNINGFTVPRDSCFTYLLSGVHCRSPDTATIRQKMLYTASNQGFRKALGDGIAREIQANDHGDLQMSNVLEICKRL